MPECEGCGNTISEEEYNDELGICYRCVMLEDLDYSAKAICFLCIFFMGTLISVISIIQMVVYIPNVITDPNQYLVFMIPSFIMCFLGAIPGIGYLIHIKRKGSRKHRKSAPVNTINLNYT